MAVDYLASFLDPSRHSSIELPASRCHVPLTVIMLTTDAISVTFFL